MASLDGYNYLGMSHFVEEFQNSFTDKSFISEMEENYELLWQFRDCVIGWNLGVSQYKDYIHLFHKESNSPTFLSLNVLEKVILIEQFHGQYIVIGIQPVNAEGSELEHVHSIIVKVGDRRAQFDVDKMLDNLSNTTLEELADLFRSKYSSWMATKVKLANRRLDQILLIVTHYLARLTPSTTITTPLAIPLVGTSIVMASGSGVQASNSRSTTCPPDSASLRVRSHVGANNQSQLRSVKDHQLELKALGQE